MFKDEERLFKEIGSGHKSRCEIEDGSGLRCTITVDGVKWHFVGSRETSWDKYLVFYTTEPQRGRVRIANVMGIDLLRESELGAAYGITYADGKKIEILVDKPEEQKEKKGKKKNQ